MLIEQFVLNIKKRKKWYHKILYRLAVYARGVSVPIPKSVGGIFFYERKTRYYLWRRFKNSVYYMPMARYRFARVGKGLCFESKFPLITGYGTINLGANVTIGRDVNFAVSYKVKKNPTITVGDNVYIGFQSAFFCAEKIDIGNRVLIAGNVLIFDNNNHPLDPVARSENKPVEEENISPVVIGDDVWIGTGACILKGVTIGKGAVVALRSVVTHDVPPMTVVAGNPARIVRHIHAGGHNETESQPLSQ